MIVVFLFVLPFNAQAAVTFITNADGQLTNVLGVVNPNSSIGAGWNFEFIDGTFAGVGEDDFGGVDAIPFPNRTAARSILTILGNALQDPFATSPELVWGCSDDDLCRIVLPIRERNGLIQSASLLIEPTGASRGSLVDIQPSADFSTDDTQVFARVTRFDPTAAVPEPETYAMILVGLGVLGFQVRKQRR